MRWHTIACGSGGTLPLSVGSFRQKMIFGAKPGRPMAEQLRERVEGRVLLMNDVHGVFVTWESRQDKTEKFILLTGRGVWGLLSRHCQALQAKQFHFDTVGVGIATQC